MRLDCKKLRRAFGIVAQNLRPAARSRFDERRFDAVGVMIEQGTCGAVQHGTPPPSLSRLHVVRCQSAPIDVTWPGPATPRHAHFYSASAPGRACLQNARLKQWMRYWQPWINQRLRWPSRLFGIQSRSDSHFKMIGRSRRATGACAIRILVFDAGPLKGLCAFPERAVFDDLATTKHEAIGKSSANPFGRIL